MVFKKLGASSLFLVPEYFDKVDFWSYFVLGISFGGFFTAFNISSYIVNAFYFPFIATLSRPFVKYTLNNFIIPLIFLISFIVYSIRYQSEYEFLDNYSILLNIAGFLIGFIIFIFIALTFFFTFNKDVYKMFHVEKEPKNNRFRPVRLILQRDYRWKKLQSSPASYGSGIVETYMSGLFKIRRARNIDHYSAEMIYKVLHQNHRNAAFFAVGTIIIALIAGIFMDSPFFMIPAGASILMLFTVLIMFYSALKTVFNEWTLVVILLLIYISSFLVNNFFNDFRNNAYGLNYNISQNDVLENNSYYNSLDFQEDYTKTIKILNKWKEKNIDPDNPGKLPKIVFINTSGGGMKAMLWTYLALAKSDSLLNGELFKHTFMITGASGGMIGASYFRELYLRKLEGKIKTYYNERLLNNLSKDMLNPVAFSFAMNDWFFKIKTFKYHGKTYYKDRAYSFEKKLNENTGFILDKTISEYYEPENNAKIPLMIFTPTIINDGRTMIISSQDVSYLLANEFNKDKDKPSYVEFRRLYKDFQADSLRFTTVLRMNSTFPYVTPIVALPGKPQFQLMDAGIRDNYGLSTSLNFIYIFRDWIKMNTSGVIIIQIAELNKKKNNNKSNPFFQFFQPLGNVYSNIFNIQRMHNEQLVEFSMNWMSNKVEIIQFNLQGNYEKISLNWRLTKKEKQYIIKSFEHPQNKNSINKLKMILEEY
ncbi:MAG: hypothetical protein Kow0068_06820 [Marinilabiliales bacterium]